MCLKRPGKDIQEGEWGGCLFAMLIQGILKKYTLCMVCKICDLGIPPGHPLRCTWAHKKRESVQTWLMTKSLSLLLFSLWSPGAPSLPSVMSGRDPKCKGLTCFSNTQTKEETLYHRWSDSVSWSRNNMKQQLCRSKCHVQTAKVTSQKLPKAKQNNHYSPLFAFGSH